MPYTGAGAAGAAAGGFGSLIPLFAQMLASMGASLDPEGPAGAVGGVTNQWIRAQSQMKMMKKLLGSGAKLTMDKGKTSITGDSSLLDNLSMDSGLSLAQEGSQLPGGSGKTWEAPGKAKQVNPFVSSQSDTPLADLAGLQGEDINQAMQLMLGQRDISRKTVADIHDAIYKTGMLDVQRQQAGTQRLAEWRRIKQIPDKVSVNVGGGKTIYVDPKNALSYYAKVNDLPTSYDTYKIARGDPEFKGYLLEMAKAGRTEINIGDITAKTTAVGRAKQKLKLTDSDYIPSVVGTLKEDFFTWEDKIYQYTKRWEAKGVTGAEATRLAEKAYIMDEVTKRLEIQYGKGNVEVDIINDEIVWKVDGKVIQRY